MTKKTRALVYKHITPRGWDKEKPSPVTWLILGMIFLSIAVFTLETEPTLAVRYGFWFEVVNMALAVLFAIEYALRVWTCVENPEFAGKRGRLRYVFTYMAIVDLVAFLPSLLFLGGVNTYWLRVLRVLRILRLLKLGRYTKSLELVISSITKSRRELVVSFGASIFFLYLGAVLLYFVESTAQPEAFGSIPRTIWWSVATLTTVGYGDVYPITPLGRFCAGIIALIGVAIVALPAGILAGGFIEEYRAQREERNGDEKDAQ